MNGECSMLIRTFSSGLEAPTAPSPAADKSDKFSTAAVDDKDDYTPQQVLPVTHLQVAWMLAEPSADSAHLHPFPRATTNTALSA